MGLLGITVDCIGCEDGSPQDLAIAHRPLLALRVAIRIVIASSMWHDLIHEDELIGHQQGLDKALPVLVIGHAAQESLG